MHQLFRTVFIALAIYTIARACTGCAGPAVYDPHDTRYDMTNPAMLDALNYSCESVPSLPDLCARYSTQQTSLYYCTNDIAPRTCPTGATFVQFVPDDRIPSGGTSWCCE